MARRLAALLVFWGAVCKCWAQYVLPLDGMTLDEAISSYPLLLVTFTAPWCGHCTSLLPELQLAAFQLHEEAVEAKIGHYDVTAPGNAVAAGRQHIDGYPTIVLYRRGQRTGTYEGGRSHRDIHEYLRKRSGALFTPISTLREVVEHTTQVRLPGSLHTSFRPLGTPTAPLLLPRAPGVLGGIRERCGHLR